jgi:hypothetical protein
MNTTKTTPTFATSEVEDWFGQLIHQIRVDKLQIESGVADLDKSEFYRNAMAGNTSELLKKIRKDASQFFVSEIVTNFLMELSRRKVTPEKLAFALTPSTILAWAEIKDDDAQSEDGILLAEAKINSVAKEFDFSLDTMVVEKSDCLEIPSHYFSINLNR